jgi:hypothetical protein
MSPRASGICKVLTAMSLTLDASFVLERLGLKTGLRSAVSPNSDLLCADISTAISISTAERGSALMLLVLTTFIFYQCLPSSG